MKLLVLSDLHNEFKPFEYRRGSADVGVLAGDIDLGTRALERARAELGDLPLIYVAGNHEYYKGERATVDAELLAQGKALGIEVLQDREVVLGGVRFLGSTLWTDFEADGASRAQGHLDVSRQSMSDYRLIREGNAPFTPERSRALFHQSRRFLAERLDAPFLGKTVVVTHHAPSKRSWPIFALNRSLMAACVSNL